MSRLIGRPTLGRIDLPPSAYIASSVLSAVALIDTRRRKQSPSPATAPSNMRQSLKSNRPVVPCSGESSKQATLRHALGLLTRNENSSCSGVPAAQEPGKDIVITNATLSSCRAVSSFRAGRGHFFFIAHFPWNATRVERATRYRQVMNRLPQYV